MTSALTDKRELTTGTVARMLRVSADTVLRFIEQGDLVARKVGPRGWYRIEYDSVVEFMDRQSRKK
jgi:excisionase family DNA binding protein